MFPASRCRSSSVRRWSTPVLTGAAGANERPGVQLVRTAEDLAQIAFVDDVAEIEVPIEAIDLLPFKNEDRSDSERLRRVENAIRRLGYNNPDPVVVRLGRRGRWMIVNGGHRVTAARRVSREFWTNLFRRKVRSIYFLLYRTPLSNTRIEPPAVTEDGADLEQARDS